MTPDKIALFVTALRDDGSLALSRYREAGCASVKTRSMATLKRNAMASELAE